MLKANHVSSFLAYRTSQYKLHYYETATNVKFVMLTDTRSQDMQIALREIYVRCYVEYGMLWFCHVLPPYLTQLTVPFLQL